MRKLFGCLVIIALLCLSGSASAQTDGNAPGEEKEAATGDQAPAATEEKAVKAEAKEAFTEARADYAEKKYDKALRGFQKAYDFDPRPEMLYNIALCQQKLGDLEEARDSLRRFLKDKPKSKARAKVELKIAEINEQIRKRNQDQPMPGEEPGEQPEPGQEPGEQPKPGKAPPPPMYNRTGLQVSANLGIGVLTNSLWFSDGSGVFDFASSAAIGVGVMHRPLSFLAYGARMSWAAQGASYNYGNDSVDSAYFIEIAGAVEFYPLALFMKWSRLDPYVGLGVGFGQVSVLSANRDVTLSGPTLHVNTGINLFVNSWISIGGFIRYMNAFWTSYCDYTCWDISDLNAATQDALPSMFILGAEGSFHFF